VNPESKLPSRLNWAGSIFILNNLVYLYTIMLGMASLAASLFDRGGRMQHRLARLWSRLILKTVRTPLTVSGLERIDAARPAVYAANHISALDIPVLYLGLPFQFRIIAKQELFRYPFLGWHLRRSGQISVDPEGGRASLRGVRQALETLRTGTPLVIFPEGGRSRNGQVQPFMSGAFYLAIQAQADIVPMAIVGTFEALPIDTLHVKPRPLRLVIGEPIPTAGHSTRTVDALAARVRRAIEDLYYSRADTPDPRTASADALR